MTTTDYAQLRVRAADKRIYGGATDVNQMLPFKYPWAWPLYLKANTHHWLPVAADFELKGEETFEKRLAPKDYLITELTFAWRVIEAQMSLALVPIIYRFTTAPECRQFFLRMMEEDTIAIKLVSDFIPLINLKQGALQDWMQSMSGRLVSTVETNFSCGTSLDYAALLGLLSVVKKNAIRSHLAYLLAPHRAEYPEVFVKYLNLMKRDLDTHNEFLDLTVEHLKQENKGLEEFIKLALNSWTGASYVHWDGHDLSNLLRPYEKERPTKKSVGRTTNSLSWD